VLKFCFGADLPKRGLMKMSSPDTFFEIVRAKEGGGTVGVYRSGTKYNSTRPMWDDAEGTLV
jgi:hypothetical protein